MRGEQVIDDPILAIEILSVSNRAETWSNVWTYCSIPSLLEIMVCTHSLGRRRNIAACSRPKLARTFRVS